MGFRALYALGVGYLVVCAGALIGSVAAREPAATVLPAATPGPALAASSGGAWFAAMKPFCNALEAETRIRATPAPATVEGAGYQAACFALAGKIRQAHQVIDRLAGPERWKAAEVVFQVGHPVADQGDDESAGPMMRLVLRYWPNNYMALYHAGMSEYVLGQDAQGRAHLEEFLRLYRVDDYFTRRAKAVLGGQRPTTGSHE